MVLQFLDISSKARLCKYVKVTRRCNFSFSKPDKPETLRTTRSFKISRLKATRYLSSRPPAGQQYHCVYVRPSGCTCVSVHPYSSHADESAGARARACMHARWNLATDSCGERPAFGLFTSLCNQRGGRKGSECMRGR